MQGQQAASMEEQGGVGSAGAILQQRGATDDANLRYRAQQAAQHSTA